MKPRSSSEFGEEVEQILDAASELEQAQRFQEALSRSWEALDLDPANDGAKRRVVRLLRDHPHLASVDRRGDIERLLVDPRVAPDDIASAGWSLAAAGLAESDPFSISQAAENDSLVLALLSEAYVSTLTVEIMLTGVRRWLLLSGRWISYPRLTSALIKQAALNGGAWPSGDKERELLELSPQNPFAATYSPSPRIAQPALRFDDGIVQAVADQYGRWPYPAWSRLTVPKATTVPEVVEKLNGGICRGLSVEAEVLIAGCGTGWEAAHFARRFPDAHITAIDISANSLTFASERCAGLGIDFHLLDLNDAALLGRKFDLIVCSGVLHHLPDPEAGWERLATTLKAGGVMKVMLYSRAGRLRVEAAKARIADLRSQPVTDDVLRAARWRLIDCGPQLVESFCDFYTLSGVHDFLFNRHEDCFDVPRIVRALNRLQLELLAFKLPSSAEEVRYRAQHPDDPLFRDVAAWAAIERANPFLFSGMYELWCRRPS